MELAKTESTQQSQATSTRDQLISSTSSVAKQTKLCAHIIKKSKLQCQRRIKLCDTYCSYHDQSKPHKTSTANSSRSTSKSTSVRSTPMNSTSSTPQVPSTPLNKSTPIRESTNPFEVDNDDLRRNLEALSLAEKRIEKNKNIGAAEKNIGTAEKNIGAADEHTMFQKGMSSIFSSGKQEDKPEDKERTPKERMQAAEAYAAKIHRLAIAESQLFDALKHVFERNTPAMQKKLRKLVLLGPAINDQPGYSYVYYKDGQYSKTHTRPLLKIGRTSLQHPSDRLDQWRNQSSAELVMKESIQTTHNKFVEHIVHKFFAYARQKDIKNEKHANQRETEWFDESSDTVVKVIKAVVSFVAKYYPTSPNVVVIYERDENS
jgi:ribosomal protein L17